ncbi:MAG: TetR/AcrR family transcriptional regulator [Actinomycetota bacterium]
MTDRAEGTRRGVREGGEPLRRGDKTRKKIVDAAEEAFGKHGYHGASIVEITRSAGVGLGTFYVYFPSKIEIYRHLLRTYLDDFVRVAREATVGAGDYREIIRSSFGAFFDWIGDRPGIMRLLREAEFVDSKLLSELYGASAAEYRRLIEGAMKAGYIAPGDPEVLAWGIMGMTELAVLRWLVWPGQKRIDPERLDAYVEVLIRACGVSAASA